MVIFANTQIEVALHTLPRPGIRASELMAVADRVAQAHDYHWSFLGYDWRSALLRMRLLMPSDPPKSSGDYEAFVAALKHALEPVANFFAH